MNEDMWIFIIFKSFKLIPILVDFVFLIVILLFFFVFSLTFLYQLNSNYPFSHFNALRKSKTLVVVVFVSVCIWKWVVWYMSVFLYTWTMTLYVSLVTPPISRWIWESLRVKVTYSLSMQRKTQSIHSTILQDLFRFSIWISVGQVICSEIENILFLC